MIVGQAVVPFATIASASLLWTKKSTTRKGNHRRNFLSWRGVFAPRGLLVRVLSLLYTFITIGYPNDIDALITCCCGWRKGVSPALSHLAKSAERHLCSSCMLLRVQRVAQCMSRDSSNEPDGDRPRDPPIGQHASSFSGEPPPTPEEERRRLSRLRVLRFALTLVLAYAVSLGLHLVGRGLVLVLLCRRCLCQQSRYLIASSKL